MKNGKKIFNTSEEMLQEALDKIDSILENSIFNEENEDDSFF